MDEQPPVLQRHDAASREANPGSRDETQERWPYAPDAITELVSRLDEEGRIGYESEITRIETTWAADFSAGRLTALSYYRRMRRLPLDYLAHRTEISLSELFSL